MEEEGSGCEGGAEVQSWGCDRRDRDGEAVYVKSKVDGRVGGTGQYI